MVDKIIEFLTSQPIAKSLVLFGGFLCLIAFVHEFWKLRVEEKWKWPAISIGASLIVIGLLMHVPRDFWGKFWGKLDLSLTGDLAHGTLLALTLVTSVVVLGGAFLARALLRQLSAGEHHLEAIFEAAIKEHLKSVEKKEKQLVNSVEDATRRVLKGFPDFFVRAVELITKAEREIWIVSFTLKLGAPHAVNRSLAAIYKAVIYKGKPDQREFGSDVELFVRTLKQKFSSTRTFNVVLADESCFEKFLNRLKSRPGYEELDVRGEVSQWRETCEQFGKLKSGRGAMWNDGVEGYHYHRLPNLPIQILIVGLPVNDGVTDRFGCLVLMVGTDIGTQTGEERGFYTEMEEVVLVYKNMIQALMTPETRVEAGE